MRSMAVTGAMGARFGRLMTRYDAFLCPTTAAPAVPADFDSTKHPLNINTVAVDPMLGWAMTLPFNMLSRCPVLAVPSGQARNGVPTGLQLVGKPYRDADVIRARVGL